jgi:TRAP-type C4-dicarboxylate transport system permease small subunit
MQHSAQAAPVGAVHVAPARPAGAMQRFRAKYGMVLEWFVGTLMVVLAVEVTLGVVFRAIGQSLVWYDEVASILLAWLTFYGSALASVKRAHIGCPEIVDQFPWPIRRALNIFAQILVILFFCLLGWVGATIMPFLAGETLVSLPSVPVNFVQSVIPIASLLIVIAEVMHLIDLINQKAPPPEEGDAGLSDARH